MPIEIDLEPGDSKTRECSQIVNGHIVACRWLFPLETTQREGASTSGCLLLLNVSLPQTDRSHPPSSSSHQRNNTHLEVHPSQPQIVQEFFDPVILILSSKQCYANPKSNTKLTRYTKSPASIFPSKATWRGCMYCG